jgi:iron complex transport system permease protein
VLPALAANRYPATVLLILSLLLLTVGLLSVGIGLVPITPLQVFTLLTQRVTAGWWGQALVLPWDTTPQQAAVLFTIRLPRVVLAVLIGAGLGVSGAAMQGLFRNPLADPGLIGVSSGAALGAVVIIVLGSVWFPHLSTYAGIFTLPAAAFAGGLLTTWVVYTLSRFAGQTIVATMLLAGIAINALAGSGIGVLSFVASDAQLRSIVFWNLGSLGGASWDKVWPTFCCTLPTLALMSGGLARSLNVLLLGEAEAGHLGVHVEWLKRAVVALVALTVGAGVAAAGPIGFIGLVVPHLLRLCIGPDHRYVLPGAALLGALVLLAADLVARTALAPAELPIGIVTAALGAPFFLVLLIRQRRQWYVA